MPGQKGPIAMHRKGKQIIPEIEQLKSLQLELNHTNHQLMKAKKYQELLEIRYMNAVEGANRTTPKISEIRKHLITNTELCVALQTNRGILIRSRGYLCRIISLKQMRCIKSFVDVDYRRYLCKSETLVDSEYLPPYNVSPKSWKKNLVTIPLRISKATTDLSQLR